MVKQTVREMLNSIQNYCKFTEYTPTALKQRNLSKLIGEYKDLYCKNKILQRAIINIVDTCPVDFNVLSKKQLNIILPILDKEYENRAKKDRNSTKDSSQDN